MNGTCNVNEPDNPRLPVRHYLAHLYGYDVTRWQVMGTNKLLKKRTERKKNIYLRITNGRTYSGANDTRCDLTHICCPISFMSRQQTIKIVFVVEIHKTKFIIFGEKKKSETN